MLRTMRLVLFCLFLSTLGACAPLALPLPQILLRPTPLVTVTPTATPSLPAGIAGIRFDAHRAFEQNQVLAVTIGKRVAGTEGGTRAGDYIAQQFAAFGYAVEKQPFPFQVWEDHGTQVAVMAPTARVIPARPLQYSRAGLIEAEVVAVSGNGTESDLAAVNLRGRIALVSRGTIPFSDKARFAAKAGAVALLIYNNEPIGFTGTLRDPASIPVLALAGADGRSLLDLLAAGRVTVKIDSDTAIVDKIGKNIIGRANGSSDGVIVFGSHYDSVDAGPGAVDNGTGTATMLELARVLATQAHNNAFVFIAFDAEEVGLVGSHYYVDHLSATESAKIRGMFNFDMLGGGSGSLLAGGDGALGVLARNAAGQLGLVAYNFSLGSNAGSDHEPFQQAGIDTIFFSRDYGLLHTPQDSIDQVKEAYLADAGRVAEVAALQFDQQTQK